MSILPLIAQLLAYLYRERSVKCDLYGDKKRNSCSRDIKTVIEVLIRVTFCFPDGKHFIVHAKDKYSLYIFSRNLLIYLICLYFVVLAFLRNIFFFCLYTLSWWEASHWLLSRLNSGSLICSSSFQVAFVLVHSFKAKDLMWWVSDHVRLMKPHTFYLIILCLLVLY